MLESIVGFKFNSQLGIFLYWIPLCYCCYGFTIKTVKEYQQDLQERATDKHYYPKLKLGTIIGRVLAAMLPVINLFAAFFSILPDTFERLGKLFDIPLVPKK